MRWLMAHLSPGCIGTEDCFIMIYGDESKGRGMERILVLKRESRSAHTNRPHGCIFASEMFVSFKIPSPPFNVVVYEMPFIHIGRGNCANITYSIS